MTTERYFTAFQDKRLVAEGFVAAVLAELKPIVDRDGSATVLIFDDDTGEQLDFNFQGTIETVLEGLSHHPFLSPHPEKPRRPGQVGRPKLGVVSREITLLPRHWAWLEKQPSGSSATLRRLVETAMKAHPDADRRRQRQEVAAKVMWSLAGDLPGFEEASRALFRGEIAQFGLLIGDWPKDIQRYLLRLCAVSD